MDPISLGTLATISLVSTAIGGAVTAGSQIMGGFANAAQYNYKAAVAKQNADYERRAGEVEAQRKGMEMAGLLGQETASTGNLDPNVGSPSQIRRSTLTIAQQEQGDIRSRFARAAYKEDVEAGLDVAAAKYSKVAGFTGAAGTLIGDVASVSDKWLLYGTKYGQPLITG